MKVLANRADDDGKNLTDATDAVALMTLTGINTYEKIVDLTAQCYPNIPGVVLPAVSTRMSAKIKGLVDDYNGADKTSPTWDAGTWRRVASFDISSPASSMDFISIPPAAAGKRAWSMSLC